ncbi:uncharacterized protein LOC122947975 [Acropora millepora]|uniref:uncharacterized protein LOC122947975 n=1 Tax=Acropora millepora TaxID=45264 RepID=UPI001CF587D3|nr:uncharacterized protein LOC122947975 [Acropora millepora]
MSHCDHWHTSWQTLCTVCIHMFCCHICQLQSTCSRRMYMMIWCLSAYRQCYASSQMNELQAQKQPSTASATVTPPSVSSSTVPESNWLPSTSAGPSSTSTARSGELQSLEKPDQHQAKVNILFHCGR